MRVAYGSGGVLYHPETGQILLHHRSADAPTNPNRWGLFGGGEEPADAGDPAATWCREMGEELGLAIEKEWVQYLGKRIGQDRICGHMFYYEWPSLDTDFVLGEGQGFAWFTFAAALALPNLGEGARYWLIQLQERVAAGQA